MKTEDSFYQKWLANPSFAFWFGSMAAISMAVQFVLLWFRDFDPDEFQHLHAAWCVSKGLVPYVDFFGHHTPGLWFLLAPAMRLFRPEADFTNAVHLLFFCRVLMWGTSCFILWFVWKLGRLWRGEDTGAAAAALLSFTLMFLEKCIETRVDVPAPLAFMASLYLVLRTVKSPGTRGKTDFAWAGFLFGAALMITQKMLLVIPGYFLAQAWYVLDSRIDKPKKERVQQTALFWTCSLLPLLFVLAYFQVHHAVGDFFYNNFILNSNWRMRFSPMLTFNRLLRQNLIITLMGVTGFLASAYSVWRSDSVKRGDFLLVLPFASFAIGAFIMPVPQREYFMEFLPLGALFAAYALFGLLDAVSILGREKTHGTGEEMRHLRIFLFSTAACATIIGRDNLRIVDNYGLRLAILTLAVTALLSAVFQNKAWLKIIAIAGLCFYGLRKAERYSIWTNYETLNNLRFVDLLAGPQETVMDGWNGVGVFRPNAWHYYFLHTEIVYMIDRPQVQKLVDDFTSGRIAPKIIYLDEFVRALSPQLTNYLRQHYKATIVSEKGTFLVRCEKLFPPHKASYAPPGRSQLPLPGTFDLVVN